MTVVTPDRDDPAAIRAALADAELLFYDWRASATGLSAADVAARAAPRLHPAAERRRPRPRPRRARRRRCPAGQRRRVQRRRRRRVGARRAVRRRPPLPLGRGRAARRTLAAGRHRSAAARSRSAAGASASSASGRSPTAIVAPLLAMGCAVSYWSRSRRPPTDERGATYPRARRARRHERHADQRDRARRRDPRAAVGRRGSPRCRPGAIVVSASRGGIVDEVAVLEAVEPDGSPVRRSTSTRPSRCRSTARCAAATGSC